MLTESFGSIALYGSLIAVTGFVIHILSQLVSIFLVESCALQTEDSCFASHHLDGESIDPDAPVRHVPTCYSRILEEAISSKMDIFILTLLYIL
jgi:hypothetical protein